VLNTLVQLSVPSIQSDFQEYPLQVDSDSYVLSWYLHMQGKG
jgi:hypothetical protein